MFKAVNPGAKRIARLKRVIFAGASIWVIAGSPAVAQTPASPKSSANLSGFWELHFDSRNIPPASLVSGIASENPRIQFDHDMNEVRWCHFFGLPYVMEQSPLDIL